MLFISVQSSWALQSALPSKSADTASKLTWVREEGFNRGKVVSQIITSQGGQVGQSWCMYFVRYCYDIISKALKVRNPLPRTGSCSDMLRRASKYGSGLKVIKTTKYGYIPIKKGDIAIFKSGEFKESHYGSLWKGHTGIFLSEKREGVHILAEGNTNARGSREGGNGNIDGVYIKERRVKSRTFPIVAYIRVE